MGDIIYRPPFTTMNEVTASRAIDGTIYANNSGKFLFVSVTSNCTVTVTGGTARMYNIIDTVPLLYAGFDSCSGVPRANFTFSFLVPPGSNYSVNVNATNGTVVLVRWVEVY